MRIYGSRRHPEPLPNFDKVVGANEWRSLLSSADYVVIATPLTRETKGLIDAEALHSMRPNAYLINIARGAVVDEPALLEALKVNQIAGAALDTLFTEPLTPESPFWSLSNVFVTPHCSGHSPRVKERSLALFLDNKSLGRISYISDCGRFPHIGGNSRQKWFLDSTHLGLITSEAQLSPSPGVGSKQLTCLFYCSRKTIF